MITKEIWVNYIVANLFKNNEFLEKCRREDANVLAGKVVHIPQAGTKPEVVKNRGAITAAPIAVRRGDGDIVYLIDEYTTNAIVIPDAEKVELSYDKMASVLDEHISALMDTIGDEVIFNWVGPFASSNGADFSISPASFVQTTGANVAAHIGTGTRKLFVKEDLQKARTLMNKQNVSREDRIALIDSEMLDQLMQDADLKRRDMALELDMKNGVINRLYGFEIIERSSVATHSTANSVKSPTATPDNGDKAGAVCFQKDCVEAALGEVKFFENPGDALYYGDVYSGLVRFGGRKRRRNAEGVVSIIQGV